MFPPKHFGNSPPLIGWEDAQKVYMRPSLNTLTAYSDAIETQTAADGIGVQRMELPVATVLLLCWSVCL